MIKVHINRYLKTFFMFFLSLSVFTTQMYATTNQYKVFSHTGNGGMALIDTGGNINYDNIVNNAIDHLFSSNTVEKVKIEVIDTEKNLMIEEAKSENLKLMKASSANQNEVSGISSNFSLNSEDSDGIYVGFMETQHNAVSRGYYVKKYSNYEKVDPLSDVQNFVLKDYIELGRAHFVKDLAINLHSYAKAKKKDKITPLMFSYFSYMSGRNTLINNIPLTVKSENFESYLAGIRMNVLENDITSLNNSTIFGNLNADGSIADSMPTPTKSADVPLVDKPLNSLPINDWYGYVDLDLYTNFNNSSQDIEVASIFAKLFALDLPIEASTYKASVKGKYTKEKITGDPSNKVFLDSGHVFNFQTMSDNFNLMTHLSVAQSFMANNNIKRGYMFESLQTTGKFASHEKCSGKIRKKCKYWQTLDIKPKKMNIYSMSYVDESYVDDWRGADFYNTNPMNAPMMVPTMIPVNTYANTPSLNEDNYGMFYTTSYNGTIGGGLYNFDLFSQVNANHNISDYIDLSTKSFKSHTKTVKSWGIIALIILIIIVIIIIVVSWGALTGPAVGAVGGASAAGAGGAGTVAAGAGAAAGTGAAAAGTGAAVAGTGAAAAGTGAAVAGTGAAVAGTGAAVAGTGAAVAGTGAVVAGTGAVVAGTGAVVATTGAAGIIASAGTFITALSTGYLTAAFGASIAATIASYGAIATVAAAAATYVALSAAQMWAVENGKQIWKDNFDPLKIINDPLNITAPEQMILVELNRTLMTIPQNEKVFAQLQSSSLYKGLITTALSHAEDKSYVGGVFNDIAKKNAVINLKSIKDNTGNERFFTEYFPELDGMIQNQKDFWKESYRQPYVNLNSGLLLNENKTTYYNIKGLYKVTVKNYLGLN